MSTNSVIAIRKPNGHVEAIYCHWDGHPDHNGKILLEHYQDEQRVQQLIALGNLSFLGAKLAGGPGHSYSHPEKDTCIAYGRDRGESDQAACEFATDEEFLHEFSDFPYYYLFENGGWRGFGRHFIPFDLKKAVEKET